MTEEQLRDAEASEQGRGSEAEHTETESTDLEAAFENEEFKKRFQSAVDKEVRARIDKWKAKQEKKAAEPEPEGMENISELDLRIQTMIDQRIRQERQDAKIETQAAKRAARFGIDLDAGEFENLSPDQKLAMVDALEAKVPDLAKSLNGGSDFNAAKKPKDPDALSPAELAMAQTMGISPENYKKQKQALSKMREAKGPEPEERNP